MNQDMTTSTSSAPLRYQSSYEQPDEDEDETGAQLMEQMRKIIETTYKDYGHAVRSVHAKSHGLLRGEMQVMQGLPAELAQGLFAQPGLYPVILRFSTIPGDILEDSVSTPRGLAVKVVGVEGERLPGSEGQVTQDFVMVNGPAFLNATPKSFLTDLKLLAATTDKMPTTKKVLSAMMRGAEKVVEAVGGESARLKNMGGEPNNHPLGETYYTQAPLLHGQYMCKICVAPVSAALTALNDAPVDTKEKPNALREAVVDFFRVNGGEWELRVQLCTDIDEMPIEDASKVWPEDQSPYVTVARITAPPQPAWNAERSEAIDDGLSFSPWHGLAAHRPIGGIMRVRKNAYEMARRFRESHNQRPVEEPRTTEDLPA